MITRVPARRGPAWSILGYDVEDVGMDPDKEMVVIFVEKFGTDGMIHMCNTVMSGTGYDVVGEEQAYGMLERALERDMKNKGVW